MIQEQHLPAALNQRVARISIRKDSPATRELLLSILCSDWIHEELMAQDTAQPSKMFQQKDLVEIQIPVPPLAEQQRIVGMLDKAFAGIATAKANAEKNLQNARALFESHLQSVFTQRGKGWVEKTLEEVADANCSLSYGNVQPGIIPRRYANSPSHRFDDEGYSTDGLKRIDPKLRQAIRELRCMEANYCFVIVAAPDVFDVLRLNLSAQMSREELSQFVSTIRLLRKIWFLPD